MLELVYISRAITRYNHNQLEELLTLARAKNKQLDITGLLLYDGFGTFIQALEGPEDAVLQLYQVIKADSRHTNVNKIGSRHIDTRSFADWQMGFKLLEDAPITDLPGFSQFMSSQQRNDYIKEHQNFAYRMLKYFRDGEIK